MGRPSQNLDRKLIAAALELLPQHGFAGLKIREVARRAGVNPGMFHYHFKTRQAFLERVLSEVYGDFLASFKEAAEGPGSPSARLRRVLVAYAHFARRNRVFYSLMVRELLSGSPEMSAFAHENFPRHLESMLRLMEECRAAGVVRPEPAPLLCMFAMSTMGLPNVAVTALERNKVSRVGGRPSREVMERMLSDEAIEVRADMVLAGLAPRKVR
ncbi:TetR/AcrR family transcriptional regulator [bacterium]|nr:MAG: TetR/AcrR family transcriptional regulator [bacterium]